MNSYEEKPATLKLFRMRNNARTTSSAAPPVQPQMMTDMSVPMFSGINPVLLALMQMAGQNQGAGGVNAFAQGFAAPAAPNANMLQGDGNLSPNPPNAQPLLAISSEIDFPHVTEWAVHCDSDDIRLRRGGVGDICDKLVKEGFYYIDQLVGDRVAQADLANALKIGLGRAGNVIKWAEEDVAQVRAQTFVLRTV